MPQVSLNATSAEAIANGTEISVVVNGVTVGEIYEMDYEENDHIQSVNTFGSRIISRRRGLFEVKGSIKSYWLNKSLRTMVNGQYPPLAGGMTSSIYHSNRPFQRYDIVISSTNPSAPNCVLKNVVFETDKVVWSSEKVTVDDVAFFAEEVYGQ